MKTQTHTSLTTFARDASRRASNALRGVPDRVRGVPAAVGWTGLALVIILAVAAYLRLRGVHWGLPYSYQNADERVVLQRAFRVARGHPNPEFFYYPSLLFYLIGTVTWAVGHVYHPHGAFLLAPTTFVTDATPYFLIGRTVVAACGVASVWLVYRLGREAFSRPVGLLAALFLAVEPLHVRYSHVAVTDAPATMFGLLALWLFVRAARRRDARTLLFGALAAGLATGTKYNLGMLVLPGAVACAFVYAPELHEGADRVVVFLRRLLRRVALPMVVAFLVSTPFAVLDPLHFLADFYKQNRIVANGWLGFENVHNGYWYNFSVNLLGSLGPVLLVLGLVGLALAFHRRSRADLIIAPYVVVYYLYVSSWHELMDRYLLPIVPLLVVLAMRACAELAVVPGVRRRAVAFGVAAALLLGAIVVPAQASLSYSRSLSGTDVRTIALTWVENHVPRSAVIAMEPYGPQLIPRLRLPYYRAAGLKAVSYDIVRLPLPVPNKRDRYHNLRTLLERDVRYVIISSDVQTRVLAARHVYPAQVRFYHQLARHGRLVKRFVPGPDERGPIISVYRLPASLTVASPRSK
ncbi:MAG TPA: glycosyltransferase family 39 protein [Thermoleophilia bacterium]|nr:glycosyltransferase family 39 protein [Thermoleophilia bacterium]